MNTLTQKITLNSLRANPEPKKLLAEALREAPMTVTFTKRDGSERVMQCTLEASKLVPYEKKTETTKVSSDTNLAVWDTEANAWRSIVIDSITGLEYN